MPPKRAKKSPHNACEDSANSSCSDTWSIDSMQGSETEGRKCLCIY